MRVVISSSMRQRSRPPSSSAWVSSVGGMVKWYDVSMWSPHGTICCGLYQADQRKSVMFVPGVRSGFGRGLLMNTMCFLVPWSRCKGRPRIRIVRRIEAIEHFRVQKRYGLSPAGPG